MVRGAKPGRPASTAAHQPCWHFVDPMLNNRGGLDSQVFRTRSAPADFARLLQPESRPMPPIRHRDHTDDFDVKIRLLQEAHATGRRDLAMSLAASIKDTIQFERQREAGPGGLHS